MEIRSGALSWIVLAAGIFSWFSAVPISGARERKDTREPRGSGETGEVVPVQQATLANGVNLLVVERPGALTVAAGWMITSGSAEDPPSRPGLAHFLEHLLFQGTETVGTRDWERERELLAREERLRSRIRRRREALQERSKPASGAQDPEVIAADLGIREELRRLRRERRRITVPGELALLYAEAGGRELEGHTFEDLSLYTVVVPPESLELWFWLESDRLRSPVFRRLENALRIVAEERRRDLATEPVLELDEGLRGALWGDHPYGRPGAGGSEDLRFLSRRELRREFEGRYRPGELTLALVGAVDLPTASRLAKKYFGRLDPEPGDAEEIPIPDPEADSGTDPVEARCHGRPRLAVLYPTVAFTHQDRPALDLLASILNGRTGRLHREIVLRRDAAWSAYAVHRPLARAGELWFRAEVAPGERPASVLPHWDAVVTALARDPMGQEELDRARDRLRMETYRGLREPRGLLSQLLIYQGLGNWRGAFRAGEAWSRVTPERVRVVVRRFLDPEARRVGLCSPSGISP